MHLRYRQLGDVTAVEVAEDTLDAERAEEFRAQLEARIQASPKVLLDLSAVTFADSTGLGAILICLHRAANAGRKLRICSLRPLVQEMFHVLRLDRLVDVHVTPEEALLAFR
ncbi:MAG TPA: STAS domain-containing protein [Planctomycetota bacterium]|nr:STAS domain-containing protein [Planctomycetota bacterium]